MPIDSPNFQYPALNGGEEMVVTPPFPLGLYDKMYDIYREPVSKHVIRMVRGLPGFDYKYQDFTQDTFLKAHIALPGLERRLAISGGELNVRPWLLKIATNLCIDELRRARLHPMDSYEILAENSFFEQIAPDNPESEILKQEDKRLLGAAVEDLPQRLRTAVKLSAFEELTPAEIGEVMGVSRRGIISLLYRARKKLRVTYSRRTEDPGFDF